MLPCLSYEDENSAARLAATLLSRTPHNNSLHIKASFWVAGMVCWVVISVSWVDRCDTHMNALFD